MLGRNEKNAQRYGEELDFEHCASHLVRRGLVIDIRTCPLDQIGYIHIICIYYSLKSMSRLNMDTKSIILSHISNENLVDSTSGLQITNESIIDEIRKIDSSFSVRSLLLDTLKRARTMKNPISIGHTDYLLDNDGLKSMYIGVAKTHEKDIVDIMYTHQYWIFIYYQR